MKKLLDAVDRNLWTVTAILALLVLAACGSALLELSRDVGGVTSCRATACGFDR